MLIFNKENFFENFFFMGFLYMVQISLFTSFFQCLHFLIFQTRSHLISLLGFGSLLISLIFLVFDKKFKERYLNLVFNEYTRKYLLFLQNKVKELTENYSFFLFLLIHSLISFTFLHVIMIWSNNVDLLFELPYQILTLIRIFFFPLLILSYAALFFPKILLMQNVIDEQVARLLKNAVYQFIVWSEQHGSWKMNKKTASILAAATALSAGVVIHGSETKRMANDVPAALGLDLKNPTGDLMADPLAVAFYKTAVSTIAKSQQSSLMITTNDVLAFLSGNPTIRQHFITTFPNLKEKQVMARAVAEAKKLSMSDLACKTSESEEVTATTSSSVAKEVPSVLESFIF